MTANSIWGAVASWRRVLASLFLGGCAMLGAALPAFAAPPTAEKMLTYKPKHDVAISTPPAADIDRCTVDMEKTKGGGGSAWVLKDPQGRLLRRYFSTTGGTVD